MSDVQKRKAEEALAVGEGIDGEEWEEEEEEEEQQGNAKRRGGQEGKLAANQLPKPTVQGAVHADPAAARATLLNEHQLAEARGAAAAAAAGKATLLDEEMGDKPGEAGEPAHEKPPPATADNLAVALRVTELIDAEREFQQLSLDGRLKYQPADFAKQQATGDTTGLPDLQQSEEAGGPISLQTWYEAVAWRTESGRKHAIMTLESMHKHLVEMLVAKAGMAGAAGSVVMTKKLVEDMVWMPATSG
eukprot:897843-Rhodomonas_salina.1